MTRLSTGPAAARFSGWVSRRAAKSPPSGTCLSPAEVAGWILAHEDELEQVLIASADGSKPRLSYRLIEHPAELEEPPEPPGRIRVLSPFDPVLRDRARAERLFGFRYRIEVFVPEEKREYGYYVFPLLRGDRVIGRIDMKAERNRDVLAVRRFWPEKGIRQSAALHDGLDGELQRVARFAGVADGRLCGWLEGLKPASQRFDIRLCIWRIRLLAVFSKRHGISAWTAAAKAAANSRTENPAANRMCST